MLKILQARLQQYMNCELPDVQAGFRKGKGNSKLPTSDGSLKKQESFRKTSTSALLTMPKPFDCVDHNKLWKILQEMEIPDHLTCMQVKKQQLEPRHGTTDWFQIGKGVGQGSILSPCLFNFYAEYIM